MVDISLPESIIPSVTADYTRGHNLRLYLPFSGINTYNASTVFLAAKNLRNDLPYHNAHTTTIDSFCNLLTD